VSNILYTAVAKHFTYLMERYLRFTVFEDFVDGLKFERTRKHKRNYKLRILSPRANYTDQAIAACQRNYCQLSLIERVAWSARQIPTAYSEFSRPEPLLFLQKWLLNCTHEAQWIPFKTHYFSENLVVLGIKPGPLDLYPKTLTSIPQRWSLENTTFRKLNLF
jgi:hypothetical protein